MNQYIDPDTDVNADWMFSLAFAQDHARYAFPVAPMQPCRNVDCPNSSYAIFCSESCRSALEGPEETAYYQDPDSPTTLGLKALADAQWQQDQAAGGFAAMVCGVQPQPVPVATPAFSEAPISITLKGLVHGVDTMVTIRGTDFATVQAQVEAASQWLDTPAAAQASPRETGDEWCTIHDARMKLQHGKDRSQWHSHKVGDSWCKGKAVRHG